MILGFNVVLFLIAMSILGVDAALYSILTYMAAARTLDFILYGIDEFTAITIISDQHAAIRERITRDLGRGVTIYAGYGGLSRAEQHILYCVVTRLEVGQRQGDCQGIGRRGVRGLPSAVGRRRRGDEDQRLSLKRPTSDARRDSCHNPG